MIKYELMIEIDNIYVGDRFYEFDYTIKLDGKKQRTDHYESDYENGMTKKEFKKHLKNGSALDLVLEMGL